VPRRPRQQPFHEPIGVSPEAFRTSRRWIGSFVLALLVLLAAVAAWLRLTERL
jgi:hypothetical protein